MEKYVSFRIKKLENSRVMAAANHDRRFGWQPSYIDRKSTYKNYTILGKTFTKEELKIKMKNQDILVKEKTNRKLQANAERFTSGIMTFSNSMKEDYERNPKLFDECSKLFLTKITQEYNFQIEYAELHLDETTPHVHILFNNISTETGKSIRRNINPKILTKIQTLMGECFQEMGYKRGVSAKITNARNIGVSGFRELEDTKKQLQEDNQTLINLFNDLINTKPLTSKQKELLVDLAPALFQFVNKADVKKRKILSNNISKALNM